MAHFAQKLRSVMGVIIDDSGGQTIQNRVARPTALVAETKPLVTQHIRREIVAKMSIAPAPRKSGALGNAGDGTAGGDRTIGPPDATITSGKLGLGGMILIGVAILTLIALLGGRRG